MLSGPRSVRRQFILFKHIYIYIAAYDTNRAVPEGDERDDDKLKTDAAENI